jgi:hypothetical protein
MANRRMFSNRIANSSKFLQMPSESQLLYFHMVQRADDDGVVESYPLLKLLGLAPDNFKVLQAKGYIRQLNEDQVIVITDWLEHNIIRADRKVDSIYKNLLLEKAPDIKIIEPKHRSDVEDNSKRLSGQSTDGISKVKLGKDRLGEGINTSEQSSPEIPLIIDLFKEVNPSYKKWFGNKTQRGAVSRLLEAHGFEKLEKIIKLLPKSNNQKYCPVITTPLQLEDKFAQLATALQKIKNNQPIIL